MATIESTLTASSGRSTKVLSILVPVGLLAAVLLAYSPALRGEFIWDDDYYVVNNTALRTADGIQRLWLGLMPDPRAYPAPQFYPMTHTSLWLDYRFWGLNPLGYHITNVVLHVLCCWVLWVILRKLHIPGATLAAFVFALHPVHVESVAWITERKNVLSGLFYLLSLLVYLRFAGIDRKSTPASAYPESVDRTPDGAPATQNEYKLELPDEPWKVYALSLLLFVCAVLSKSVAATLPGAILLIIFWNRRRIDWRTDVLPLVPFFVLGLAMSGLTSWIETSIVGAYGAEWDYSWAQRIIIAGNAVWFYIGKLILPVNLMFMYPKWTIDPSRVLQWLAPLLVVIALCLALLSRTRLGDVLLLGTLFFGGTLLPALGFFNYFPMRYSFVADHMVYLASLGLIVPACALGARLFRSQRAAGVVAGVLLCAGLGVLSFRQSRIYSGPEALWRHTIANNPRSWMAHNNLGVLMLKQDKLDAAEAQFGKAIDIRKDHAEAILNLGRIAERRRNLVEAERLYQLASEMNKDYVKRDLRATGQEIPRRSHSNALVALAKLRLDAGDLKSARSLYDSVLGVDATNVAAITGLGEVLRRMGEYDNALELQMRAIELDPQSVSVRINLGSALADMDKPDDAMRAWISVLKEDVMNPEANNNVGLMLVAQGKWDDAITLFDRAIKARPEFADARRNLEAVRRRKVAAATKPTAEVFTVPTTQPAPRQD